MVISAVHSEYRTVDRTRRKKAGKPNWIIIYIPSAKYTYVHSETSGGAAKAPHSLSKHSSLCGKRACNTCVKCVQCPCVCYVSASDCSILMCSMLWEPHLRKQHQSN